MPLLSEENRRKRNLLIIAGFLWVLVPFRRLWPEIASLFVAFAAIFGWLLPWLAA